MATRSAAVKKEVESNIESKGGKAAAKGKEAPTKGDAPKKNPIGSSKYKSEQVITLLVDYNPKRAKSASHARFEKYEDEMTVAEALKAGIWAGDLNWDVAHGFVKIADEFDEDAEKKSKPEPKPRAEKAPKGEKAPKRAGKGKKVEEEEEEEEEC